MKCADLNKRNGIAYLVDENNVEVNIESLTKIDSYERKNKVEIKNLLNELIQNRDNKFQKIIESIEEMVSTYKIEYYVYGDCSGVLDKDTVALIYVLNNRDSNFECHMKVFYGDEITYMISFHGGTNGSCFGYEFFRKFTYENYFEVSDMLLNYFKNNDNMIIDMLTDNVRSQMNNC